MYSLLFVFRCGYVNVPYWCDVFVDSGANGENGTEYTGGKKSLRPKWCQVNQLGRGRFDYALLHMYLLGIFDFVLNNVLEILLQYTSSILSGFTF